MKHLENKKIDSRFILIFVIILVFVILCTMRLFNLQVVNGKEYREKAENRMYRAYPIKAPRGEILDTYGRPMVTEENRALTDGYKQHGVLCPDSEHGQAEQHLK